MARGFYSTDGAGTTDAIDTGYTGYTTAWSMAFWAWRTGAGGGDLARLFDKDGAGGVGSRFLFYSSTGSYYVIGVVWTGSGDASWTFPQNGTGAWAHFVITYDGSSSSNNPAAYINGVSQTLTPGTAPSGSLDTSGTGSYRVGNRSDGPRAWNGRLAEFAHWGRILTAGEIAALANGYAPAFFPSDLIFYYPMLGRYSPENDQSIGTNYPGTVTGTAYQAHPRIIYPSHAQRFYRAVTDVTVALTGIGSTGAVGSVLPSHSVVMSTVLGTGSVGTLPPSHNVLTSGVLTTGGIGSVAPSHDVVLTTNLATGAVGTLSPSLDFYATLTGVEATGDVGSVVQSRAVPLISQTLTITPGTLAPASETLVSGNAGTSGVGSVGPEVGIPAASVLATASVGSILPSHAVPLTGETGTGSTGTVTGEVATTYQAITGVEATGALGTPGVDVTIALSGILVSCIPGYLGSTGGTPVLPDYIYFHRPYVRQEGH